MLFGVFVQKPNIYKAVGWNMKKWEEKGGVSNMEKIVFRKYSISKATVEYTYVCIYIYKTLLLYILLRLST